MNVRRDLRLSVAVLIGGIAGLVAGSCGSNADRCEEACTILAHCQNSGANCWKPAYHDCVDLCLEEDDWGPGYVRCLRRNRPSCCALDDCG